MTCDKYFELLSARLDGALTEAEEQELEAHTAVCPDCRAAGAQLAALQGAFHELEEEAAPEGFAQGVMERVRAEAPEKKIVPLFKRPQFRALAGLAACLVLVIGLYAAARPQDAVDKYSLTARGFSQSAPDEDSPQISAYSDPGALVDGETDGILSGMQKSAPMCDGIAAVPMSDTAVLTLERMPEGACELIPAEALASPEGLYVTQELLEQVDQLAAEQGITASMTSNAAVAEKFVIIVLEEVE